MEADYDLTVNLDDHIKDHSHRIMKQSRLYGIIMLLVATNSMKKFLGSPGVLHHI
jgi:hypothetical protein